MIQQSLKVRQPQKFKDTYTHKTSTYLCRLNVHFVCIILIHSGLQYSENTDTLTIKCMHSFLKHSHFYLFYCLICFCYEQRQSGPLLCGCAKSFRLLCGLCPSVCLPIPYGLLTQKKEKHKKAKIGVKVLQGRRNRCADVHS